MNGYETVELFFRVFAARLLTHNHECHRIEKEIESKLFVREN